MKSMPEVIADFLKRNESTRDEFAEAVESIKDDHSECANLIRMSFDSMMRTRCRMQMFLMDHPESPK